ENIMQQDVVLYLYHEGGKFQESPCPYSRAESIYRGEIQRILNNVEASHPGALYNVKKFTDQVYPLLPRSEDLPDARPCPACGAPKSQFLDTCMACFYIRALVDKDYATVVRDFLKRVKN
nr:hypothetical protein [Candidatus Sigynarchaeota archaeon]